MNAHPNATRRSHRSAGRTAPPDVAAVGVVAAPAPSPVPTRVRVLLLAFASYLALALTAAWATAQGAAREASYPLAATVDGAATGSVWIGDFGDRTVVVVRLRGAGPGPHPAHFHAGDCGSGGGIVVPLADVGVDESGAGLGVTLADTPFDAIVGGDHYLNVHASAGALDVIVACGEVGAGAPSDGAGDGANDGANDAPETATPGTDTAAGTDAGRTASGAPRTASYGLFAVEGSGVNGQLQVTERVEAGGTTLAVTLQGIEPGTRYGLELYRGDCGPDRERVETLEPVGSFVDDPYASVSERALAFDDLARDDLFLYVLRGDDGPPVACGEVGAGANR